MASPGSELKKIRLERGISLEGVQKKTKIQLNILKAIEGDSLTNLSPVYLKGFLKIYCNFLGVDPKDYTPSHKEPIAQATDVAAIGEEPQGLKKSPSFFETVSLKLKSLKIEFKKIKTALISIIVTIFVIFVFFNLGKFLSSKRRAHSIRKKPVATSTLRTNNTAEKKEQIPDRTKVATKVTPKTTPTVASPSPVETKIQKETSPGIRLGIRTKENCWMFIKVDGRVVFQRVLEKGRFENWQAKEKIELSVGNAGAVDLEVNGQLFSNLGRKGQALKNIVITKDGLNIAR
jgi:cytoskeletal protein RodZ